jgi:hypothetical protein
MVMEEHEQPPASIREASAPQVAERPLWELSRDEQRVLIITFVGGLTSIVAGVCIVGGAIALVRGLRAIHYPPGWLLFWAAAYIFAMAYITSCFRGWRRRPWPGYVLIGSLLVLVTFAIFLLALIGMAAGIH